MSSTIISKVKQFTQRKNKQFAGMHRRDRFRLLLSAVSTLILVNGVIALILGANYKDKYDKQDVKDKQDKIAEYHSLMALYFGVAVYCNFTSIIGFVGVKRMSPVALGIFSALIWLFVVFMVFATVVAVKMKNIEVTIAAVLNMTTLAIGTAISIRLWMILRKKSSDTKPLKNAEEKPPTVYGSDIAIVMPSDEKM